MKTKFKIGNWVLCRASVKKEHKYYDLTPTTVVWEKKEFSDGSIIGQICGASYRYNGYIYESGYGEDYEKYFSPKGSVFVYDLKLGLTNKPFYALEEDLELLTFKCGDLVLPFRYVHYTQADREYLSEISKDYERDKRGRFI
jgi:hypothetical protein